MKVFPPPTSASDLFNNPIVILIPGLGKTTQCPSKSEESNIRRFLYRTFSFKPNYPVAMSPNTKDTIWHPNATIKKLTQQKNISQNFNYHNFQALLH
jgi:hypothetical protein